jgi:hypothetical protein
MMPPAPKPTAQLALRRGLHDAQAALDTADRGAAAVRFLDHLARLDELAGLPDEITHELRSARRYREDHGIELGRWAADELDTPTLWIRTGEVAESGVPAAVVRLGETLLQVATVGPWLLGDTRQQAEEHLRDALSWLGSHPEPFLPLAAIAAQRTADEPDARPWVRAVLAAFAEVPTRQREQANEEAAFAALGADDLADVERRARRAVQRAEQEVDPPYYRLPAAPSAPASARAAVFALRVTTADRATPAATAVGAGPHWRATLERMRGNPAICIVTDGGTAPDCRCTLNGAPIAAQRSEDLVWFPVSAGRVRLDVGDERVTFDLG